LLLLGCASSIPTTEVVTSSPNHITVCSFDARPGATQQAEGIAQRHCAAQGLVPRSAAQGTCPTHYALRSVRYECARL
jgi:hypothetical protein